VTAGVLAAGLRRSFLAALLPLALVWFGGLEYRGLFHPDEGRYAEIPREMLASGDWVTPRLNNLKYFEKPPLQYWATALALAAFGEDEWSARLWPAVTGFLGILLLAFAGNRTGPPGSGYVAGLVLASSVGYFVASQYLTLDMGLTFFLCAAMCAMLMALRGLAPLPGRRAWMLLAWTGMACAVLSKGLVGIVLPGAAVLAYVLLQRDWHLLRRLEWKWGGALFALIVLPWHLLAQWRNPEFFHFYIVHEHLERFLLPGHGRPGAWWYFILILLLAMIPWTIVLPGAIRRSLAARVPVPEFDVDRFLLLWVGVILLFFSASSSKLPAYIVPALPALALLVGRDAVRHGGPEAKWPGLFLAFCGAATLAIGLPALTRAKVIDDLVYAYFPWFAAGAGVFVAGGLTAWGLRHALGARSLLGLAFSAIAGVQFILSGLHQVDENYSTERFVEQMLGEHNTFAPDVPFYSVGFFDESLPYYLGRTLTLVSYRGELAPGIVAEPGKYVESLDEFERRWVDTKEAYAAMQPRQYAAFRSQGLPMRVLAIDSRRVIVSRDRPDPPLRTKKAGRLISHLHLPT
jgi:4-amino-4-deoxy-L-arabinose transferase-like glycosyltransferase